MNRFGNNSKVPFNGAVRDCTGGNVKIKRRDYELEGILPIIDQGQEFIAGYVSNANAAYSGKLPVVVFGDHTRCFKYIDFPFVLGADGVKVLEPLEGFNAEFLYYYFRSIKLPSAGYSRHFKFLCEVFVPKPSLFEQHRVVDIISRAEGVVRMRREAQKKAAELIPALFLDMFGDPATNPKGWQEVSLGSVIEEFRYGTSQKSGPTGYPTLRIPNVIGDRLDPSQIKFVAAPDGEAQRLRLHDGDLLFVRTNGNPDYVGRSAVFNAETMRSAGFEPENCLYASYLIRGRIMREIIYPHYLQVFLSSTEGRRRLKERCRTSAGQYNINIDGLSSIVLPLPPIDKQFAFEEHCPDVFSIQAQQEAAMQKAKAAFEALLARYFGDYSLIEEERHDN
jgi:type I restriction enzyme, S subunit